MRKTEEIYKPIFETALPAAGEAVLDIEASTRYFRTSRLLRIDLMLREDVGLREVCLIAEREADEYELLCALPAILKDVRRLVTFNGNSFDLPHLRAKYRAYREEDPLEDKETLDLMHALRETASFFALPSRSLKDFAYFLGLKAADGHPLSDAEKTAELMSMLSYRDFLEGRELCIRGVSIRDNLLIYELEAAGPFPRAVSVHDGCFHVQFDADCTARLSSRIVSGALRYYHTDVRNYEYLPLEGYAVHRSASAYVDPSRKEKASRETCFHLFHLTDAFLRDSSAQETYLKSILAYLRTK